jgi:hypothetical protein
MSAPIVGGGVGAWTLHRSSRSGAEYYFHGPTKRSLYRDAALPFGWAWSKASEAAPRVYTNLLTDAQQSTLPTAAASAGAAADSSRAAKRPRPADDGAIDAGAASNPVSGGAPAAATAAAAAAAPAGERVAHLALPPPPAPMSTQFGFCDEAPPCLSRVAATAEDGSDGPFFGAPHRLILRQLVKSAAARHAAENAALAKALVRQSGRDAAAAAAEVAARALIFVDIGAGAGGATRVMLDGGGPSAQVR